MTVPLNPTPPNAGDYREPAVQALLADLRADGLAADVLDVAEHAFCEGVKYARANPEPERNVPPGAWMRSGARAQLIGEYTSTAWRNGKTHRVTYPQGSAGRIVAVDVATVTVEMDRDQCWTNLPKLAICPAHLGRHLERARAHLNYAQGDPSLFAAVYALVDYLTEAAR